MIPSGFAYYGQSIGVLVFAGTAPRIPGDPGHSKSFAYPVQYGLIEGSFTDLIEASETMRKTVLAAGMALVRSGAKGIVGDCGLLSLYQDCAADWGVPFVSSSLCLIPSLWQLIGRKGAIGVITGHSKLLGPAHLFGCGCTADISLSVQGMELEPHFRAVVIQGGSALDPAAMEKDLLHAGSVLKAKTPRLKAIVLECSNLGSYSAALQKALGVPVFDTLSAANLLQYGICPPAYPLTT